MSFLFNVIFAYRHSYLLESSGYADRLPDLVLLWAFGWVIMLVSSMGMGIDNLNFSKKLLIFWFLVFLQRFQTLAAFTGALVLNQALTIYLIYIWSRRNPHVNIDFVGLLTFPVSYLTNFIMYQTLMLRYNSIILLCVLSNRKIGTLFSANSPRNIIFAEWRRCIGAHWVLDRTHVLPPGICFSGGGLWISTTLHAQIPVKNYNYSPLKTEEHNFFRHV